MRECHLAVRAPLSQHSWYIFHSILFWRQSILPYYRVHLLSSLNSTFTIPVFPALNYKRSIEACLFSTHFWRFGYFFEVFRKPIPVFFLKRNRSNTANILEPGGIYLCRCLLLALVQSVLCIRSFGRGRLWGFLFRVRQFDRISFTIIGALFIETSYHIYALRVTYS